MVGLQIKQYFHFIREHISNNQLSEDLFKTPSRDKKSDEAYVIHFMKYNCIMLYMELDRTDKVNHSQRMKVSIVKYVLKIDSSEYKFSNYFLIFCA